MISKSVQLRGLHKLLRLGIVIIVFCGNTVCAQELLELSCLNATDCEQYQHSGFKSACVNANCQCSNIEGQQVQCQPTLSIKSNFIGGQCPCKQQNSECNAAENVCYCAENYMPSKDMRRCLNVNVQLNEICEQHVQCQTLDPFTTCIASNITQPQRCRCQSDYQPWEKVKVCAAVLSTSSHNNFCTDDKECKRRNGEQSLCAAIGSCYCRPGFVAAANRSACLAAPTLHAPCEVEAQCQSSLGPAGRCLAGKCVCHHDYELKKLAAQHRSGRHLWCERKPVLGKYCRYNEDCYELNTQSLSMLCDYGQCNCRSGFTIGKDSLRCVREEDRNNAIKQHACLCWPLLLLVVLVVHPLVAIPKKKQSAFQAR